MNLDPLSAINTADMNIKQLNINNSGGYLVAQTQKNNKEKNNANTAEKNNRSAKNTAAQKKQSGTKPKAKAAAAKSNSSGSKKSDVKNAPTKQTAAKTKANPSRSKAVQAKSAQNIKANQNKTKTQTAGKTAKSSKSKAASQKPVKITFIGGLNEIGKNITMYEYGNDAVLVDCGMAFPDDQMLGIDIVIPDFSYVLQNASKIRGVVLTHAHEDHIGALPYLLKELNLPIYGTKLTIGLVDCKLKEHGIFGQTKRNIVKPGETVSLGGIDVEFINVNHSIPDAVAVALHTESGAIIHTGDFKMDSTPVYGEMIDLGRFAELGKEGVLCLLSDSTNAERAGFTMSEKNVGNSFETLFSSDAASSRRIIIATFASNLQRIQQIIDCAAKHGRKVAISGRSMINAVAIAQELGYLTVPEATMIDLSMINRYRKDQIVLITTGSQGEPMSAMTRMAFGEHRQIAVGQDDFIIISATPIPGNEKMVGNVVNELLRHGCEVVYEKMYEVHVSGHACQEELKMLLSLVKPQYFIPVHGEQKHLKKHAMLAHAVGIPDENVLICELGDGVEVSPKGIKKTGKVQAGRVLVDGYGVGDVGSVVLRDRKHLGEDGLIIVAATVDTSEGEVLSGPDVVSRGFVYVRDAEPLIDEIRELAGDVLDECMSKHVRDWNTIKNRLRDELSKYLYERTKRSPMILPIIMDI